MIFRKMNGPITTDRKYDSVGQSVCDKVCDKVCVSVVSTSSLLSCGQSVFFG